MLLDTLALDDVAETHLRQLVVDEVREGRSVDFKEELPGNSYESRREFLADVSSFSNTIGGHLLLGVAEDGGVATDVPGFPTDNVDHEIQRLVNMILNGLEPRASEIRMHPLRLASGNWVIVLRIARSWSGPHRVSLQGHDKFYMRDPGGKHPMGVEELRAAFTHTYEVEERIRRLRTNRLDAIASGEGPAILCANPKVVLHIVPFSCFDPLTQVPVARIQQSFRGVLPLHGGVTRSRATLEGYLAEQQDRSQGGAGCVQTYVQCTRAGVVEAVDTQMLSDAMGGAPFVPSVVVEDALIEGTTRYLRLLDQLAIQPPLFLMLTLLDVGGYRLAVRNGLSDFRLHRSSLVLPEELLQSLNGDTDTLLRPTLDSLWNAWGYVACGNYAENGHWRR